MKAFSDRLIFTSVGFEKWQRPPSHRWASSDQSKAGTEQRLTSQKEGAGNSAPSAFGLELQLQLFAGPAACSKDVTLQAPTPCPL
jgi:hypothetical protein